MQEKNSFVLKGNICYSDGSKKLVICPNSYVVCQEGICKGVYQELPKEYEGYVVKDMGDALITPGLVDLHTHAPQYAFSGLGNGFGIAGLAEYAYFSGGNEIC